MFDVSLSDLIVLFRPVILIGLAVWWGKRHIRKSQNEFEQAKKVLESRSLSRK